ncbi:DUF397 domain-containing protein [Amycolatopsis anabasis]|uniref:DUF397 domain-containing protein n=1 Tax=Amycolatopsis anabasis TaxID=1840409 RepID=UPI00131AC3DC
MSESLPWRTSSYTGGGTDDQACVELAVLEEQGKTLVRDTKNRRGGILDFSSEAFGALLNRIKAGKADYLHS